MANKFNPNQQHPEVSVENQDMMILGAGAELAAKGHDLNGIDPALAAIALTDHHETRLRILADTLGDVQKIDGDIVGDVSPHSVRDKYVELRDKGAKTAGRVALITGLMIGGGVATANAAHDHKPNRTIQVTKADVVAGAAASAITGGVVYMPTLGMMAGGRGVRRRAKRELNKQLKND